MTYSCIRKTTDRAHALAFSLRPQTTLPQTTTTLQPLTHTTSGSVSRPQQKAASVTHHSSGVLRNRRLHEPSPVPVALPDGAHGLERYPLGLRQERHDEGGHDGYPGRVVDEGGVLERAQHGEERLREQERGAQVDGHADALPRRPDLHGEYLARDHPGQRAPRPAERRREDARQRQHREGVGPGHRGPAVGPDLGPHDPRDRDLADDHDEAAGEEQRPPAVPVDRDDGQERGGEVDGAEDDGAHERGVAAEPGRLEQHGREEGDDDDPRELLEQRDRHGHGQVVPVLPPEDPAERALLVRARGLHGAGHVLQLRVHVRLGAPDAPQRGAGLLRAPAHEEAAGRVRDEQRPREDDGGGRRGQAQREAPPPRRDARGAVVHQVRRQVADAEEELEPRREGAPPLGRRRLRQEGVSVLVLINKEKQSDRMEVPTRPGW
uniref:Uncharacterized protein n=1 Tax=Zea mays TaxID=4577 RepID=A0A804RJD5_MAIZE